MGRDTIKEAEEWSRGELYYSVVDCMWYIETEAEAGDWFRLGDTWEEVCWWVYEEENNDEV